MDFSLTKFFPISFSAYGLLENLFDSDWKQYFQKITLEYYQKRGE